MNELHIQARAKINLGLNVLSKQDDGYHKIKTIMQSVDLSDELFFEKSDTLSIKSNVPSLDCGPTNIIYKCIEAIQEYAEMPQNGLKVVLQKRIPMQAGLGGGSADGAAALIAYNDLYDLRISKSKLAEIGKTVGADIPFMIYGGRALCEGVGEQIKLLPIEYKNAVVIVKPHYAMSTKVAYEMIDRLGTSENLDFQILRDALNVNNEKLLREMLLNAFEGVLINEFPQIIRIKELFRKKGSIAESVSGSGSAVFGIFQNDNLAKEAYNDLSNRYDKVYLSRFTDTAIIKK